MTAALLILTAAGCQSTRDASSEPGIFDERANGKDLINAALGEAAAEHKDVILLFGANWCPYCRQLHAMLQSDPVVSPLVESAFIVVPIDVGTSWRNRNTTLIDRYQANVFTDGTPSVVVIDSQGRRLAPTSANPWSARNPLSSEGVSRFLTAARHP